MEKIIITFDNGEKREYPQGVKLSEIIEEITLDVVLGVRDRFPIEFMNTTPECYSEIIERWESMYTYDKEYNKTILAQLLYFKNQF